MTDFATEPIDTALKDNRTITVPQEWLDILDISFIDSVQITLVDDKIAIHKPFIEFADDRTSRKVGDYSYIRSMNFTGVLLPPYLLRQLSISSGDKIVVSLEEHCIAVRKNAAPEPEEPAMPEPSMAFCCVCGMLFHTESGSKVLTKYICGNCVEVVKAL
jgi:bifunctional DNA-binding transcriptional regulator/antitoxin component of YhaV-PrlF toxin-antitoxin module